MLSAHLLKQLKFLLVIVILISFSELKSQQIITIGTGSNLENIPAQGNSNYGWTAIIYPSWDIGATGNITKIAFDIGVVQSNSSAAMVQQKIYIKEVPYSYFSSTGYINPSTAGAILVFDGSIQWNTLGWKTISLDQDYTYNGGHLLVLYENHGGGSTADFSNLKFKTTSLSSPNRCKLDNNWAWFPTSSGYYYNKIPNMQLTIIPIVPNNIAADAWILPQGDIAPTPNSTIKVRVKNKGVVSQDTIAIKYSIDNGISYILDTIYNSIAPSDTFTHTFSTPADLTKMGQYNCTLIVQNQGDTISLDDSLFYDLLWVGGTMSGAYSIGSNPQNDFKSLVSATNTLKHFGMSSSVVFELDTGIFIGKIELSTPINGLSASNTIIIRGKGENTIITASLLNANESVFLLKDNDNITIDSISIIGEYSNVNHSVLSIKNSDNVAIKNSFITSQNYSVGTINNIYASDCNYLELSNNIISGGKNGINIIGSTYYYHGTTTNLKIINNRIIGFKSNGIRTKYQDSVLYENNYIETSSLQSDACIGVENNTGGKILKNILINNSKMGTGLDIIDCAGNVLDSFIVLNNMISVTKALSMAYGIYMTNGEYVHFYNNSVLLGGSCGELSRCFYAGSYSNNSSIGMNNNKMVNNTFVNLGEGYAIRILYDGSSPNFFTEINYNNLYTNTNKYVWYGTQSNLADHSNIASWKTNNYGFAQNSISTNPLFFSEIDLHSRSALANDSGLFIYDIVDDIDGDLRNSALYSDMGADEYDPFIHEMELLEWNNPTTGINPSGSIPISILVANYGTQTQSNIPVKYSIDNGATYILDTILGPILSHDSVLFTFSVLANMASNTIYQCKAIIDLPLDQNHSNDTIFYEVYSGLPLAGAYTLGSYTNSDFASFAQLNLALSSCGISAAVVIYLDSGLYNEQISFGKVVGSSLNNTITIKGKGSDNTTLINTAISDYLSSVIKFENAHFYNIDSLRISRDDNPWLVHGVYIERNTSNIKITNCVFDSGTDTPANFIGIKSYMIDNCCLDYYQTINSDSLLIKNNTFIGGEYGVFLYSNYSDYIYDIGNKVVENSFINQISGAIYFKGQKSLAVIGNSISNNLLYSGNYKGITLEQTGNAISVKRNKINVNGRYGIYIFDYYKSSAGYLEVYNNFVDVHQYQANYSEDVIGVYGNDILNSKFINNTVRIGGSVYNTGSALSLYDGVGNSMILKNNIFINEIDGPVINIGWHYPSNLHNDNNNLISNSGVYVINGSTSYSLLDWKTASSAPNTVSIEPEFYSNIDMHANSNAMDNLGVNAGVQFDIDGDVRNYSSPDIGADEYDHQMVFLGLDISFCEGDSSIISSNIGNYYSYLWTFNGDTLNTSSSSIIVDTGGIVTIELTGNSPQYDTLNVNMIPYPMVDLGADTIVKMLTSFLVLNAGNPQASWLWSTGDTTQLRGFGASDLLLGDNEIWVQVTKEGCSSSDTIILTLVDDTSIDSYLENNEIRIYPNPNKGSFNVDIEDVNGDLKLELTDLSGKTIYQERFFINGVFNKTINVDNISKGVYIMKIVMNGNVSSGKIIIN